MSSEQPKNGNGSGDKITVNLPVRAVLYILGGVVTAGATVFGITSNESFLRHARPDPWTSTDDAERMETHKRWAEEKFEQLRADMVALFASADKRMDRIEKADAELRGQVRAHETYSISKTSQYDSDIAMLKERCKVAYEDR